jgi:hypothetical protein
MSQTLATRWPSAQLSAAIPAEISGSEPECPAVSPIRVAAKASNAKGASSRATTGDLAWDVCLGRASARLRTGASPSAVFP